MRVCVHWIISPTRLYTSKHNGPRVAGIFPPRAREFEKKKKKEVPRAPMYLSVRARRCKSRLARGFINNWTSLIRRAVYYDIYGRGGAKNYKKKSVLLSSNNRCIIRTGGREIACAYKFMYIKLSERVCRVLRGNFRLVNLRAGRARVCRDNRRALAARASQRARAQKTIN